MTRPPVSHPGRVAWRESGAERKGWPSPGAHASGWPRFFPALALAAGAVALRLTAGAHPIDDAYITFRYVRNLLDGTGFVYNAGEYVLGTSSPAYAMLLAAGATITGTEIQHTSLLLNACADAAVCVLLAVAGRRLGWPSWAGLTAAAVWALYPLCLRYSLGGMETPVAAALLLGCVVATQAGRESTGALLLALAMLTTPDMAVVALFALVGLARRVGHIPWLALGVMTAVALPWIAWATIQFGHPVPQSLLAKSLPAYALPAWKNAVQIGYQLAGLLTPDPSLAATGLQTSRRFFLSGPEVALLSGFLAVTMQGVDATGRLDARLRPFFAGVGLTLLLFAAAAWRNMVMAEWYLVPYMPILLVAFMSGLVGMSRALPGQWRRLPPLAAAALVLVQVAGLKLEAFPSRDAAGPRVLWVERERLYREAAAALRPLLRPGDVVAAPEIGALGYSCNCTILDTVGLVSPASTKYRVAPGEFGGVNYAIPADLIHDLRPDVLVTLDVFIRRTLLQDDRFRRDYQVVWERPTSVFGSRRLIVFRRTS